MDTSKYQTDVDAQGRHMLLVELRPGVMCPILDRHGNPFDFREELQNCRGADDARAWLTRVLGATSLKPPTGRFDRYDPPQASSADDHSRDAFFYGTGPFGGRVWR